MYNITNRKGQGITREHFREALQEFGKRFGKRGILHACEVVEDSKLPGVFVWVWGAWSAHGTYKELEKIERF